MFESAQELASNDLETFLASSDLLLKYAENILKSPQEAKYRRVRLGNKHVEKHLLEVPGGMQCLFDMGFEEDGDHVTLSLNSPLDNLRRMKNELLELRRIRTPPQSAQGASNIGAVASNMNSPARNLAPQGNFGAVNRAVTTTFSAPIPPMEKETEAKILASFSHVLVYQSRSLQEKARSIIPREELMKNAEEKKVSEGLAESWLRDLYLLELLAWFKNSFFQWVDTVPCERCGGATVNQGALAPTNEELRYGGTRVENHFCLQCQTVSRFPRYNHPGKLLETRRGRCGEWANCFTLICIAEGYEARYVLDWTDHVWTEVFSEVRGERWIHLDPCENVADRPLLYEQGWGKQLTYVIAFSLEDIQDVTWRYVSQHAVTLKRRVLCREEWLVGLILRLRAQRQNSLEPSRRRKLLERNISELVEFLLEPQDSESGELGGRTTGSEEWRRARGETGSCVSSSPVIIKPNESEIKLKLIQIKYNCASDEYWRGLDDSISQEDVTQLTRKVRTECLGTAVKGWKSFTHESLNIARKVEQDWKKAYLARTPGGKDEAGELGWKFDFGECGLVVDWMRVEFSSECFQNGRVQWMMCGDEQCLMLDSSQSGSKIDSMEGSSTVHITARLTGGEGSNSWQHAQVFRQSTSEAVKMFPFRVVIRLKATK